MKVEFESYPKGNCMDIICETDFENSVFKSLFENGIKVQKCNSSIRLSSQSLKKLKEEKIDDFDAILTASEHQRRKEENNYFCDVCKDECDCHMFVGGSGKACPECSLNLNKEKQNGYKKRN